MHPERARRQAATQAFRVEEKMPAPRPSAGIAARHSRGCGSGDGGSCTCTPTYQAQAWSAREKKPVRRTFPTLRAAQAWRQEAQVELRRGQMNVPSQTLVREAADEWLQA